jgi:uncharacterized protein (TIGR03663 family)
VERVPRCWSSLREDGRDRIVGGSLTIVAAALRLWALDLRPLHHDEGSNAIFILRLLREGVYQYDPSNYHGPVLYYLSTWALALCGVSTFALRLVPAMLGTLLVPLAWSMRRELGRRGAAAAAVLIAVSPSMLYYSRDNIHEIYFVTLTLAMVCAGSHGWRSGAILPVVVAGAAAGGLIATKETAPIALGAVILGAAAAWKPPRRSPKAAAVFAFLAMALLVAGAFYSRGFREPAGLLGPIESLRLWTTRAAAGEGHQKPWWYFLRVLSMEEPVIVTGALLGVREVWLRRTRGGLFILVWSGATLAVYSAIPYKTPWLVLNMIVPIALLAGTGIEGASRAWTTPTAGADAMARRRRLAAAGMSMAVAISLRQAILVSFVRYDDDRIPIVYVQTRRDALRLVRRIEEAARSNPAGLDVPIEILSPDYLPLNWYLRDFTHVAYHGHPIESPGAPIVIARIDSADEVSARLGPAYSREEYDLRPGVRLCLFVRHPDPEARFAPGL